MPQTNQDVTRFKFQDPWIKPTTIDLPTQISSKPLKPATASDPQAQAVQESKANTRNDHKPQFKPDEVRKAIYLSRFVPDECFPALGHVPSSSQNMDTGNRQLMK